MILKYNKRSLISLAFCTAILIAMLIVNSKDVILVLRLLLGMVLAYNLLFVLYQEERLDYKGKFTFSKILLYITTIGSLIVGINYFSQMNHEHHSSSIFVIHGNSWVADFFGILLAALLFYLLFTSLYLFWERKKKTENASVKTELITLKSQINPHFYFNTLNNLYALIKVDPDQARAFVLKLSDLMRYTIYEGSKKFVALEEEVDYIENYLDLQASRFEKKIDVSFEKNIDNLGAMVRPLLFINLLENAFKHGIEKLIEGASIHVSMTEENGMLTFSVKNRFDPKQAKSKGGIGLKNLRDRLNHLYPSSHILKVEKEDDIFMTELKFPTST